LVAKNHYTATAAKQQYSTRMIHVSSPTPRRSCFC
jgi:hypothetical protein